MGINAVVRKYCPNIAPLRRWFTSMKLSEFDKYRLDQKLVSEVEAGDRTIAEALEVCRQNWPKRYESVAIKAKEHYEKGAKDLDGNTLDKVLFSYFAYGFNPDEFLSYGLVDKSFVEQQEYISNRDTNIIVYSLNDIVDIDIFYDKWRTYELFKPYFHREAIKVEEPQDYERFDAFAQRHPRFVKKEVRLSKGDSVSLVDLQEVADKRQLFETMILAGRTILEEPIRQSAAMEQFNKSSVNTVRVITVKTDKGIEVVDTFLKVGREGSFVDNGGAGGLLVGIDKNIGKLSTVARDEFANVFEAHPDSDVAFIGHQLPDWDELIAMAKDISSQVPRVSYIGWDFAHTDNGWIVVEGNGGSQLIGPQIVFQEGMKKRFLEIAKRAKSIIPVEL